MSADLALAADPSIVERAADPAEFIIAACERAKAWLREALDHGDIEQIVECKSQAEAIRVYTMSKQLGKDAELSATEIVRRAERGIGVAIRRGQEAGEIRKKGDDTRNQVVNGNVVSPKDAAQVNHGSHLIPIYEMTDGVSDEDFEEALGEARAEGNLSRANVVRRVRRYPPGETATTRREKIAGLAAEGNNSSQIARQVGLNVRSVRQIARDHGITIPADQVTGKTRHLDSNRIVRETVHALEGLAMGVQLADPGELDRDEIKNWTTSLTNSIRVLSRLIKQMREEVQ